MKTKATQQAIQLAMQMAKVDLATLLRVTDAEKAKATSKSESTRKSSKPK